MDQVNISAEHSRALGRAVIASTVDASLWKGNRLFAGELKKLIESHRIMRHPIIELLNKASYNQQAMIFFHLEFHHAFAQIFTDALIQTMFRASALEPRLGAVGKVSARFLLQLNLLDELGFVPGASQVKDQYVGNPHHAHYAEYDKTLKALGVTPAQMQSYQPSPQARKCRASFEDCYDDYTKLAAILAVSESVFTRFAGPWAKNVDKSTALDVTKGYHAIHVEHDGQFIDDDHSEDAWYVLCQAMTPDRYDGIQAFAHTWLETWTAFLDMIMNAGSQQDAKTGDVSGKSS